LLLKFQSLHRAVERTDSARLLVGRLPDQGLSILRVQAVGQPANDFKCLLNFHDLSLVRGMVSLEPLRAL
jgi:hypothetical protein